jgi:hypothetical protein
VSTPGAIVVQRSGRRYTRPGELSKPWNRSLALSPAQNQAALMQQSALEKTQTNAKLGADQQNRFSEELAKTMDAMHGDAAGKATNPGDSAGGSVIDIANRLSDAGGRIAFREAREALMNLQPRIIELLREHPGRGVIIQVSARRPKTPPQAANPIVSPAPWQFVGAVPLAAYWRGSEAATFAEASAGQMSIGAATGRGVNVYSTPEAVATYDWDRQYVWILPLAQASPAPHGTVRVEVSKDDFEVLRQKLSVGDVEVVWRLQQAARVAGALAPPPWDHGFSVDLGAVQATVNPRVYEELLTAAKLLATQKLSGWQKQLDDDIIDLQARLDKTVQDNPSRLARAFGAGKSVIDPHLLDAPRFHTAKAKAEATAGNIETAVHEMREAFDILLGVDDLSGVAELIAEHEQ